MTLAKPPLSPAAQLLRRAQANGALPAIEPTPFSVPAAPPPPSDTPSPTSRPLTWLWPLRLPRAHLTLLLGPPDSGKSFLALDLALRAAAGLPFPATGTDPPPPVPVLFLADPHHLALARHRAPRPGTPGPCQCHRPVFGSVPSPAAHTPSGPIDFPALRALLAPHPTSDVPHPTSPRLLVIDSLSTLLSTPRALRAATDALASLAAELGTAVLATLSLRASRAASTAAAAAKLLSAVPSAPAAFLLAPDQHAPRRRLLLPLRSSLCQRPPSISFRITPNHITSRLDVSLPPAALAWDDGAADSAHTPIDPAAPSAHSSRALAIACDWLRAQLDSGPVPVSSLLDAARCDGLSQRTLERARAALGVHALRRGNGTGPHSAWFIALRERAIPSPFTRPPAQPAAPTNTATPTPKTANTANTAA